ncbi:hypothetical protein [Candidatus Nitrososphaera evergladensis]|uniref:hypothetical protein n=1 Tax=Candidatus Nitrososphaera evergladensis TaxID=1459637 RepID=UPI001D04EB7B|nr:hypothetical protein [Candidatus Nitrososphaera evergladensis]
MADYRMTRRHWQILNLLSSGQRSRTEALQSLAPFWDDATQSLDALLDGPDGMIARHWVRSDDGATGILALTD